MQPRALSSNDRSVLDALNGAERPLSAYQILDRARSSALRAPVQVYRSLQRLERAGLVHRIEALSAFVACSEQHAASHQPGFVICRNCGAVREFEDARLRDFADAAVGPEFKIDLVSIEILGRCGPCAGVRSTEEEGNG